MHRCTHWSWAECREAFGWDLNRWIYFGGYPGAAAMADDEAAWKRYVTDSLIETILARDALQMQTVTKPALRRHLFALAAHYPARVFSCDKMLGQLRDAGNTITLAAYLRRLRPPFSPSGLELYAKGQARKRGSSPKLVLSNNALVNAPSLKTFSQVFADGSCRTPWARKLLDHLQGPLRSVTYWRDAGGEVGFVISHGVQTWAVEERTRRQSQRPDRLPSALPQSQRLVGGRHRHFSRGLLLPPRRKRGFSEWQRGTDSGGRDVQTRLSKPPPGEALKCRQTRTCDQSRGIDVHGRD